MGKLKHKILLIIGVLVLWQMIYLLEYYPKALLPSVMDVFYACIINGPEIFVSIVHSFMWIALGLVISLFGSILMIFLGQLNPIFESWFELFSTVLHPLPGVALLPLVIMWFGIGEMAILVIVIHAIVWPVYINMYTEFKRVKEKHFRIIHIFHLNFIDQIKKIYVPGVMPGVISGLKIGWSRGWRGFISAEMIFGIVSIYSGMGWFIFEQRVYANTPALIAGIIGIVVTSIIVESVFFTAIERHTIKRWMINE